jgi:hypothetical protein
MESAARLAGAAPGPATLNRAIGSTARFSVAGQSVLITGASGALGGPPGRWPGRRGGRPGRANAEALAEPRPPAAARRRQSAPAAGDPGRCRGDGPGAVQAHGRLTACSSRRDEPRRADHGHGCRRFQRCRTRMSAGPGWSARRRAPAHRAKRGGSVVPVSSTPGGWGTRPVTAPAPRRRGGPAGQIPGGRAQRPIRSTRSRPHGVPVGPDCVDVRRRRARPGHPGRDAGRIRW